MNSREFFFWVSGLLTGKDTLSASEVLLIQEKLQKEWNGDPKKTEAPPFVSSFCHPISSFYYGNTQEKSTYPTFRELEPESKIEQRADTSLTKMATYFSPISTVFPDPGVKDSEKTCFDYYRDCHHKD